MKYQVKQVGQHRGNPRLYFQSQSLADNGFKAGTMYRITQGKNQVTLEVDPKGPFKVSGKMNGDKPIPVIDLNSRTTIGPVADLGVVKVVMEKGKITVSKLSSAEAMADRAKRLGRGLASATLMAAAIAFGGGVLDHSAHAGIVEAGLDMKTVLINEIDDDLAEHARWNNPVVTADTTIISAPMQEAIQDDELMSSLPKVDVFLAGIPCSGASRAGKSKNGNAIMEEHEEVGHLAHSYLTFLQKLQPSVFLIENVKEYADSASASMIRLQARDMGYKTQEVVLNAKDFGSLEARERWFMLGTTHGVNVDLKNLEPAALPVRMVSDILDTHGNHHWGTFQYLKDKAVRDKAAGKGFQMQVVDLDATRVPTLRKGYHKGGSTDPLLQHPEDPNLMRLFSGDEHARIKGVDPTLVAGLSNTDKHILLGQSVCPGPVKAIMRRVGEALVNVQLPDNVTVPTLKVVG